MKLGPYEVVATLGQGGMGVVHAARSPGGGAVAIKVLRKTAGDAVLRFERERRLLASFGEAQGFVPLLDAGVSERGPYLVMPLLPGGTLRKKLEAGPLGIEATIELGRTLALALGEAHARGVVHRDMKPENVLFTAAGRPLIADLGLAKHFAEGGPGASQSVSLSLTGSLRGTAGYMAPEQMDDAKSAAPAADVFSLGAILYECLAGAPPFVAANMLDLLMRVADGKREPLRARRPDVPPWLALVVERALATAAWDRFPDGLALGRALAARGATPSTKRFVPALLVLGVVLVLAASFILRPRAASEAKKPVRPESRDERPVESRKRAEAECVSGADCVLRGDLPGAIEAYTRAIALDPGLAPAWTDRGIVRGRTHDYDGSIADFDRAIALDPLYVKAWANRGVTKRRKGDLVGAIEDDDRALALAPAVAQSWVNRSGARIDRGDLEGALADATKAVELDPSLAQAWGCRALVRSREGDADGAMSDGDRAIELDPSVAGYWGNRGLVHLNRKDFALAIADTTRAIELDPTLIDAWCNRAGAKGQTGDLAGALADYEHFLAAAPDHPMAAKIRAEVERLRGLPLEKH